MTKLSNILACVLTPCLAVTLQCQTDCERAITLLGLQGEVVKIYESDPSRLRTIAELAVRVEEELRETAIDGDPRTAIEKFEFRDYERDGRVLPPSTGITIPSTFRLIHSPLGRLFDLRKVIVIDNRPRGYLVTPADVVLRYRYASGYNDEHPMSFESRYDRRGFSISRSGNGQELVKCTLELKPQEGGFSGRHLPWAPKLPPAFRVHLKTEHREGCATYEVTSSGFIQQSVPKDSKQWA